MPAETDKSIGPIIGTLVIMVVLIIASLYAFASHIDRRSPVVLTGVNATSTVRFETVNNKSDDVKSLRNDLINSVQ